MKDARPWTYAALFGSVWGALELSVGTVLKLSRLPLSGLVMTLLGLACLVTLRRLQPGKGVCLLAGLSAAVIKVFAMGGVYPGPVIGILVEALLVEVMFDAAGGGRIGAVTGGALAAAANPLQMLLMVRIVAGGEAVRAYALLGVTLLQDLGIPNGRPATLLAVLVAAAAIVGAMGGALSRRLAGRVERRLGEAA